jgi:hypothetical protein
VRPLLAELARLRAALAGRRVAAVLLGACAAALALLAVAALAARAGVYRWLGWGPLAVWVVVAVLLAAALRRALRARAADRAALRFTAALVEREQALRRGALVGLVDAASAPPAGTSAALVESAARRLAGALPGEGTGWAPATARALARRVRDRAAALAVAAGGAAAAFWFAGGAAAPLASPLATLRASLAARVAIRVTPSRVPRGGTALIRVRTRSPWRIALHVRETGETWHPLPAEAAGPGVATARLTGVAAPTFVFATSGGAVSDTVRVDVIEPAFVTGFTVTAHYPAYLEREDETLPDDSAAVALPVGTVLTLRGEASTALSAASLAAGRERVALAAAGRRFQGRLVVRGSATWRLALADTAGTPFAEPLPVLSVRAVPDSAPVVTLPVPGADTTAPLDLQLPLVVDAHDDHALGDVEIVSWRISRLGIVGARVVDTVPGMAGADHAVQSFLLDMNGRGLLPGDTLRLFARASDRAPQPHQATSRVYAIRLRTMSELRSSVRSAVDSLAGAASDLAGDQSALGQRTGDLAVQQPRGESPSGADPESAAGASGETPPRSAGALPFEQAQQAARIREEQQRVLARADSLRQALKQVAEAAAEAGLNDPSWQQRLRQLDSLLQAAVTPEMAARLEELRQALERLDPRAVQEALRHLAEAQRELKSQLERSAELFERAALEGSLETYAQNAEALRRAEERWAARAPSRQGPDTAGAAAEQRELQRQADSLRADLAAMSPTLRSRGDSATAGTVERSAARVGQASRAMGAAAGAMSAARQQEAEQGGEEAARTLAPVADSLRQRQRQMSESWRAEVLKMLRDAEAETVTLALDEQGMADHLRRGDAAADLGSRQSALEQGVDQIVRRLGEAAGRNALVSPQLGAALGRARQQVEQSRRALEGPRVDAGQAAASAQGAAQALAAAAFQIMRTGTQVAASHSGSGMAEALERLAAMTREQGGLNDQLAGMLPMFGAGPAGDAVLQQLRAIAARQRALAAQLERLGNAGMPGHPELLAPEARRLADQLESGRLDPQTLARQQELYRHMLDAGRTLQNDQEDDRERRSRTGRQDLVHVPQGALPKETVLRYPIPSWDQLKALTPAERAMVLDYFRRINGQDR